MKTIATIDQRFWRRMQMMPGITGSVKKLWLKPRLMARCLRVTEVLL